MCQTSVPEVPPRPWPEAPCVAAGLDRLAHQLGTLRHKAGRLASMIDEAEARRRHLADHLAGLGHAPKASRKR